MSNKKTQTERLALFSNPTGYEEKHIGDQWFVKHFNGNTKRWQVGIYSEDSFRRYKSYTQKPKFSYESRCFKCGQVTGFGRDASLHSSYNPCPLSSMRNAGPD